MGRLLYVAAAVLVILWAVGTYYGFGGGLIHVLLFFAVSAVLFRVTRRSKSGHRHNLFIIAVDNFPGNLLATSIGIAFLTAPFLFNFFRDMSEPVVASIILTVLVIGVVPISLLYIVALFRAPGIRRRKEVETEAELQTATADLEALKVQEQEKKEEIVRLEQVVTSDTKARQVKDEKEDSRWDILKETLRIQDETDQHLKEEHEVARAELASGVLKASQVKDLKEDARWDLLNEKLRAQNEKGHETKEEREAARQELASGVLKASQVKDLKEDARWDLLNERLRVQTDDARWNALHERLRIQEERSAQRDLDQLKRDEEFRQMRNEEQLKECYRTLFARYIRQAQAKGLTEEVADGLAPIPEAWLKEQPEIRKTPALMLLLAPYNER